MIIAIVNQKGGTGKTTTTVNLGFALAELGKKVALIDLDPQASLTFYVGLQDTTPSLPDALTQTTSFQSVAQQIGNVTVVPSDIQMADVELNLAQITNREQVLKKWLDTNCGDYDYVLIDCPPSLSILTLNALTAAHQVLIPMQMEVLSLQGLGLIDNTLQKVQNTFNPTLRALGIVPTLFDKRRKVTQEVMTYIQENFEIPILKSYIPADTRAIEAPSFGKSLLDYAPNSSAAMAFRELAKEILNKN
jgi:chromosome partitioning protein